jgi:hypothetical protein
VHTSCVFLAFGEDGGVSEDEECRGCSSPVTLGGVRLPAHGGAPVGGAVCWPLPHSRRAHAEHLKTITLSATSYFGILIVSLRKNAEETDGAFLSGGWG